MAGEPGAEVLLGLGSQFGLEPAPHGKVIGGPLHRHECVTEPTLTLNSRADEHP
jgi:hypothetical protein